jgi:hypothetical protein
VLNAHITSHTIHIGGETRDCQLNALERMVIEQNLVDSEIVIEDAGKMRTFMTEALAKVGFGRIEAATDGQQGLELFAKCRRCLYSGRAQPEQTARQPSAACDSI